MRPGAAWWHEKSPCASQQANTRATRVGSWTLYHGPFSLSIRATGWGKIAPGSSSGKAPSGCCDPRKTADFKAENSRVRHRFAGVRHGLAEAGEAAFPPCSMMETPPQGKAPSTPAQPHKTAHRKKEIRRETQTIKKTLPPGQKKAGFSCGAILGVFLDIVGEVFRIRAQTAAKVRIEKRVFGGHKKARKHRRWTPGGALRCHCTRGKCAKLDT